ncbi:MAG: di-heme enzyme [Spirochaetia bacterium]|nr:di-heme enzyme [Spirochaetia bacterium]
MISYLKIFVYLLIISLLLCKQNKSSTTYQWNLPQGFYKPSELKNNIANQEKVELGRYLFYDKKLSGNQTQSCSSCHIQSLAFTDGQKVGVGSTGQLHKRNSQSLVNAGYFSSLTWVNSLFYTLEQQSRVPLFGINPIELGLEDIDFVERLKADPIYPRLFSTAFSEMEDPITEQNMRFALGAFVRTLISGNSRYDQFRNGISSALNESEKKGLVLFMSDKTKCSSCHTGINFTDASIDKEGEKPEPKFHDIGLYSTEYYNSLSPQERGYFELSGKITDIGRFRTPSLRNIALTYPYMHDGSIDCSIDKKKNINVYSDECATEALSKVIDHFISGGKNPSNKDKNLIRPFALTNQEKIDLINFLKSLTDEEFIKEKKFSNPFI